MAGVPDIEVFQAADRVLARGMRPTVERVRAELGRGSPARVGQLLEVWWDKLAKRLAGETRLPELPPDVATAFSTAWAVASEHAAAGAQSRVAEAQSAVEADRATLANERTQWIADLESARSAVTAASAARQVAEQRLVDHQRLIEHLQAEVRDVLAQRDQVQRRSDTLEHEFLALGAKIDALEKAHATERGQAAAHVRAVEDRAHAEVDRAREELKNVRNVMAQRDREHRAADQATTKELRDQASQLRKAEREAASQQARANALETQLARMASAKQPGKRPSRPPLRSSKRKLLQTT
jgi:hypothetical protein